MITCKSRLWAFAVGLMICSFACAADDVRISRLAPDALARTYEPVEFRIDPAKTYVNPFDSAEVSIDAIITTPAGQELRQPAFWYQQVKVTPAEKQPKVEGAGDPFWMARICPTAPGKWSVAIEVKDSAGVRRSAPQALEVQASDYSRGFVRVAGNKRYLAFDSGESFFPIGLNMAWGTWGQWAEQYDGWFQKLAENEGNFARIWMTVGKWQLVQPGSKLNQLDLLSAAYHDEVLAAASRRGIYVMLCFVNHRDLINSDMWGEAPWPKSPYNAANGGPATRPTDFFTDPRARAAFRNCLRYIVGRYGAYRSLAAWELFNEQEFANCGPQVDWNREMSDYIKSVDPYKRLVSTSCHNLPPELWSLPNIDLTQAHYYGDDTTTDLITPAVEIGRKLQQHQKPQLLAEFGISFKRSDEALDKEGIATSLHNSQWAAMMSGSAGGAWHWWWDSYIAPKSLWHVYKPFARFAKQIDWARSDFRSLEKLAVERVISGPLTLGDAVLPCSAGWGKNTGSPITISQQGKPDRPLPGFLYSGVAKKELRAPTILSLDLAQETQAVIRVSSVSDLAVVRVTLDGKPYRDFAFSALPGADDIENTKPFAKDGPWQATINKDRTLTLPAGKHTLTLDNVAGDWVKLDSITLKNAIPAKYADIDALAIQDAADSKTLLWILDQRSNWSNDREGKAPAEVEGALVTIPLKSSGAYSVTWWDTREGKAISEQSVEATSTELQLRSPKFTRDIAAILQRRDRRRNDQ